MRESSFRASHRPHPVLLAAAASVITFSLLGIGAITGLIPSAYSRNFAVAQKPLAVAERSSTTRDAGGQLVFQTQCSNCGVVDAIRAVQIDSRASAPEAVAGGASSAAVGNQEGNAHGLDALTLLGGEGGAFGGHSIEKTDSRRTVYRVTVRMDDGSFRTVSQAHAPDVAIGGKVRIANGSLVEQS